MTHDSYKWTAGLLIGAGGRIFGALGPKSMEIIQSMHHFLFKAYMVYSKKKSFGRKIFLLGLFDKHVRRAFGRYLLYCLLPWRLFKPIRLLSIGTVQAPDLYPDGRTDTSTVVVPPDGIDPVVFWLRAIVGPDASGSTVILNESLVEDTFLITMDLVSAMPEE